MPVAVDPQRVQQHVSQIEQMISEAPVPLAPVLQGLRAMLNLAQSEGTVPDRPRTRPTSGPGGNWRVSRFAAHGQPWVGLEWPAEVVGGSTIDWLRLTTSRNGVSSQRPDLPSNQLWVHLGAR